MILTTEKGCLRADLQSLGDLVADGKITDDDAYHVRMMSAFCTEFAPARLQSVEHANRQIEWLSDPERVQWLGLTADNARDAIAVRETWIAARIREQVEPSWDTGPERCADTRAYLDARERAQ